jgi:hypothetical protein
MRATKRNWIPLTIRIPKPIHGRLQQLLKAKPHYTQQAIIIDLLERGLPDYTRAGGPRA